MDKLLLLSDGYAIYNGKPINTPNYYAQIGIKIPMFTNPADFIIKMAINPFLVSKGHTILSLAEHCV